MIQMKRSIRVVLFLSMTLLLLMSAWPAAALACPITRPWQASRPAARLQFESHETEGGHTLFNWRHYLMNSRHGCSAERIPD